MFEIIANLHFLRPWWFLALLPIFWIIWRIWQTNQKQGAWHQVIDPKFRTLLLGENSSAEPSLNEKIGYLGLAFAWVFSVIALSGPWVKSVDVPAQKSQQGVVLVLDLSLSMLADDVAPNRLARVKYTLTDLLKQNPDYAIGMVAYAGTAHTIAPISEDNKTLLSMLPSLTPTVMPKFGSEPMQGMQLAEQLLTGAQITEGHIIWITDDIESRQMTELDNWVNSKPYSISLLSVGSEQGGVVQIPGYGLLKDNDDKLILPKTPLQRFAELEDDTLIKWHHLQVGIDNTQKLLPPKMTAKQNAELEKEKAKGANHPLDIGFYFLFILIPLAAFIFRRGTLLNFAAIIIIPSVLLQPNQAYAKSLYSDLGDVFKSHDQQGYEAWEQEQFEKADALFDNPQWRASALYRQGKYKEAARLFELDKSATGYFNQGNAYTKDMQLDRAIKAYEQALLIDPNMQIAKNNLEIVHQLKNISEAREMPAQANTESSADAQAAQQKNIDEGQEQNQLKSANESQQEIQNNEDSNKSAQEKNQANASGDMNKANDSASDGANESESQNNENSSQSEQSQAADKTENTEKDSNTKNNSTQQGQDNKAQNDLKNESNQGEKSAEEKGSGSALAESKNSSDEAKESSKEEQAKRLSDSNKGASDADSKKEQTAKTLTEEEQAKLNWLNQIPDQPGLFLKRKFEYQFQQNPGANNDNEKQW